MNIKNLSLSFLALLSIGTVAVSSSAITNQTPLLAEDGDAKCQKALDLIDLNVDTTQIVSGFRLPNKGQYGAAITWASSNTAIAIATDSASGYVAKVTRGSANVSVTLTATATLKNSPTATKDFILTVLKKGESQIADIPLALDEDFSSYATDIELSNYFKYQSSSSDVECAHAVEEVSGNINNMPSAKALAIASVRTASALSYTRTINVAASEAASGAVLEGDFLVNGDTNGVAIELTHSGSVVAGFSFSSSSNEIFESGSYVRAVSKSDSTVFAKDSEVGVWEHFRLFFKPSSGRSILSIYDWNSKAYVNMSEGGSSYIANAGVSSGAKGDVDGLRFKVSRGSKFGTSYLANLKMDTLANMPEKTPNNHNRTTGIGDITGYEETIFAYTGESVVGLNPEFVVHNRFDESKTLAKGRDYSVVSSQEEGDENTNIYVYTFTLLSTQESKTVKQYVYLSLKSDLPSCSAFKGSYLKLRKVTVGSVTSNYGYVTISGEVYRGDMTLHYVILSHGSAAPTAAEVVSNSTALPGYKLGGSNEITSHEFSFDSDNLPYGGEYDAYAVLTNSNGSSVLYSTTGISTVVNVSSCEEFHDMSSNLDTLASTFRLTEDLDFSSYYWELDPTERSFTGIFDGQGHSIKNLTIQNATMTGGVKTGIFFNFNGTFKNASFVNAIVSGYTDVAIIGGNSYGCTVTNVSFSNCTVKQDEEVTGGDGYFSTIIGRCRGGESLFENITIDNSTILAPQRSGLLVAGVVGTSNACKVTINNVVVTGSIKENGAHAGLVGRNQSGALEVTNAYVGLEVRYAKKEVAAILGRNETGGTLKAHNIIGDLIIKEMTQPTYFGQFIGYDAKMTGSGGRSFDYEGSNLYFFDNDYSDLGDSLVPVKNAVNAGTMLSIPDSYTQKFWETKTFLRDLDTSLTFSYDEENEKPVLDVKASSSLSFTASEFESYLNKIDETAVQKYHYEIMKADNMLPYLSSSEKGKLASGSLDKLARVKAAYEKIAEEVSDIGDGI